MIANQVSIDGEWQDLKDVTNGDVRRSADSYKTMWDIVQVLHIYSDRITRNLYELSQDTIRHSDIFRHKKASARAKKMYDDLIWFVSNLDDLDKEMLQEIQKDEKKRLGKVMTHRKYTRTNCDTETLFVR